MQVIFWADAARTTARMAGFMPGASPPLVSIPNLCTGAIEITRSFLVFTKGYYTLFPAPLQEKAVNFCTKRAMVYIRHNARRRSEDGPGPSGGDGGINRIKQWIFSAG